MMSSDWYSISNLDQLDTPALVVYPDRVRENIRILKTFVSDVSRLRPHIKTSKSFEVASMLMQEGINQFKCATIAEAEMLAQAGAMDVLLAFQPLGPKAVRLLNLVNAYSATSFACLVDNLASANYLNTIFQQAGKTVRVFIDLNVGMNRTGIVVEHALELFKQIQLLPAIEFCGLHAYDGHLRDTDLQVRTKKCDEAFEKVEKLQNDIASLTGKKYQIIAGGTPTFPIHAKRKDVVCSPGTFIYWDKGYQSILQEQPFLFAALVVTRIVSMPANNIVCADLGHKSIASENALTNRVFFLNAPDLQPIGHSEEHLVLQAPENHPYEVGQVLYGVPYHICPTVALHDRAAIAQSGIITGYWKTKARDRVITV